MSEPDPQPRDIALEQETPELAADLEAQSEPEGPGAEDRGAEDRGAEDPGTDDPAEISEGRS